MPFRKSALICLLVCVMSLSACVESPVSSTNVIGFESPASTLSQARAYVLDAKAQLASPFYRQLSVAEPRNSEAVFFDVAIRLDENRSALMKAAEITKTLRPGNVLLGAKRSAAELASVHAIAEDAAHRIERALESSFDPIVIGQLQSLPGQSIDVVFDRLELAEMGLRLRSLLFELEIAVNLNFDGAEALDAELEGIRAGIYEKDPTCAQRDLPHSLAVTCVNRVLAAGLALLRGDKNRRFANALTLSDTEKLRQNFTRLQRIVALARSLGASRAPLDPMQSQYFRDIHLGNEKLHECLVGRCIVRFAEQGVLVDLPAFFTRLPRDLRQFLPKRFEYPDSIATMSDFLGGIELNDPTIGGLFPNGDGLAKAKGTNFAEGLAIYFALLTAWALPDPTHLPLAILPLRVGPFDALYAKADECSRDLGSCLMELGKSLNQSYGTKAFAIGPMSAAF